MKYEFDFDSQFRATMFSNILSAFARSESCFEKKDLPRNIRNTCDFSAQVKTLVMFGADVDAHGIYNDNGFDRIGYARINSHEFVKNGIFYCEELTAALDELAKDEEE